MSEADNKLISNQLTSWDDDVLLVRLAREIAMDHFELEDILRRYGVSVLQWEHISKDAYFTTLLQSEMVAWNGAHNTHERSKLKAAAVIEDWLPEAHRMLHARGETLTSRVGLASLLSKIAGMGVTAEGVSISGGGERFVININLGKEKDVRFEKVINAELGAIDGVEKEVELTPMQIRAQSGGGVRQADPFAQLNPVELVKKW